MPHKHSQMLAQFSQPHRFQNFGPALSRAQIHGFRGITDLKIDFESPITAFSGLNGTGKSTILQLLACGYKAVSTERARRYYVKDFFTIGVLDPQPFFPDAWVEYSYASKSGEDQKVRVRRVNQEWSGYKRQPERIATYVGFTLYIPKVERRDFSVMQSRAITIQGTRNVDSETLRWAAKILGNDYNAVDFAAIRHQNKLAEIGRLSRAGATYSESNMGFGEGRVLYLVDLLEKAPANSVFLLEEPETSLHPAAQFNLAEYLVDVVLRKKHQILLTTHSERLLSGLPSEARQFLWRTGTSLEVLDGVSTNQASCFLTGYRDPALLILVEDLLAKTIVLEAVRATKPSILKQLRVEVAGDKNAVRTETKVLRRHRRNVIGIRDGDVGESVSDFLYKLPGTRPPEVEVTDSPAVKSFMLTTYQFDIDSFLRGNRDVDHHSFFDRISSEINAHPEFLIGEAVRIYVSNLPLDERTSLVQKIGSCI